MCVCVCVCVCVQALYNIGHKPLRYIAALRGVCFHRCVSAYAVFSDM